MELPFTPETELERAVCADPEWLAGAAWGAPRPGHPEGSVAAHVAAVLANVELHDEGYNAWVACSHGREKRALERIRALVDRLGPALPLFWKFFQADNALPGKRQEPTEWFRDRMGW